MALEYIVENIRNHSAIELQRREKLQGIALLSVSVKCYKNKRKKSYTHEIYLLILKDNLFFILRSANTRKFAAFTRHLLYFNLSV